MRYPADRLTTWVIDDGSQDRTQLLAELAERHPSLQVIHRERDAGEAKSGALNTALRSSVAIGLVLDADAQLQDDLLESSFLCP